MKANELRIGNYVQYPNLKKPIRVSFIDTTETNTTRAQPIPLTEEWLLKFGFYFVIAINNRYLKDYGAFYFTIMIMNDDKSYQVSLSNHEKREGESIYVVGLGIIKHVHQLQNLYFALTGEELEMLKLC